MKKAKLADLKQTQIHDAFWDRYTHLVKDVIIPYQWDAINDNLEGVEKSHSLMNYKIAAGREQGEFYGAVFQDTDVAKWLEAVGFTLAAQEDKELEERADGVIDIIAEAQQPDGYINTYFTVKEPQLRWTNLQEGHELYTAGHLMEAAVAYYRATGKRKFLDVMRRFADLICDVFSDEKNNRAYPGHQEVEIGLVKLYEVTGERRYLEQAKRFLDRRGVGENYFLWEEKQPKFRRIFPEFTDYQTVYSQSHLPVREQKTAEGHAVRAVYMYCAMADVAAAYDDEELLNACITLWKNITTKRMYITGGIGSSGLLERFTTDYDLPNNRNYSETCASIGLALFGRRMAQITKNAAYMDVVESALYNTVLAGVAMDGKSFFYVNPLEVWPQNCIPHTSLDHVKPVRQKWFGVACCPPNIARTLASLGEYVYFYDEDTVWVNLFIAGRTTAQLADGSVEVQLATEYPDNGRVRIKVNSRSARAKLAVRIPGFAPDTTVTVDGRRITEQPVDGYMVLPIGAGAAAVTLDIPLEPRVMRANPNVREDIGKVAVVRGPVVYCLEETDNGSNLPALYLDTDKPLRISYDERLFGGATVIYADGGRMVTDGWREDELYAQKETAYQPQKLTFVPYAFWGNRAHGEMLVWVKENR